MKEGKFFSFPFSDNKEEQADIGQLATLEEKE